MAMDIDPQCLTTAQENADSFDISLPIGLGFALLELKRPSVWFL